MKYNTLKFFFTLVLLAFFTNVNAQTKTKEEAVNRVYTALQQKDEKAFIKIFPDAKTTIEFIKTMMAQEGESLDDGMGQMMKELMDKVTDSSLAEEYARDFNRLMKKADKIGLDFSKAKLVKTVIDSSLEEETKLPYLSGKVYFNSDQTEYFFKYSDILFFEGKGWYGVEIERLDLKSKENEPEVFDPSDYDMDSSAIMVDTAMVMVDTTVAASEPVQKEVPVKKSADNKTKTKTKSNSPAKKED